MYSQQTNSNYLLAYLLSFGILVAAANGGTPIATELVAGGLSEPVALTVPRKDEHRLFVVERKPGRIRIIKDGTLRAKPFLDLTAKVNSSNAEQGLLGLAFHPKYKKNGYFYVNYTNLDGDTVIERYRVSKRRNFADPDSGREILLVDQPRDYHNGGTIAFGPNDRYLYVFMGDGGVTFGDNLDMMDPLGKILRLDVDSAFPYTAPPDNPFVDDPDFNPVVWAHGVRNPWGAAFDPLTGDLWFGDVGEIGREELDFQLAISAGGQNYGWPTAEGFACKGGDGTCGTNPGLTPPIHDYNRDVGRCIVGGRVYRGSAIPELQGTYFFADFYLPIWSMRYDGATISEFTDRTAELDPPGAATFSRITAFGQDNDGEIYLLDYHSGSVYKIVPGAKKDVALARAPQPGTLHRNTAAAVAVAVAVAFLGSFVTKGIRKHPKRRLPAGALHIGFMRRP
ncbi:MAG: PQQ-dependent sugar dehydrogenase [Candidatus Hydrogenedentes bacterium]|nr:PQQ-dependent sugar dehydrogenase [Candidatus Hydrogenedentota bacterium]